MKNLINKNFFRINLCKYVLILIHICSLLFLVSCYSEYISMNYKIHHGACWNDQHTQIAFILSKCAYKSAEGISRFPDGGTPEYLLRDVGLYVYNTENNSLYKAVDFNDLTDLLGHSRSSWKTKLAYTNSSIYYSVLPLMEWDWYLKKKKASKDPQKIHKLKEKYSSPRLYNEKTKKVTEVDSSLLLSVFKKIKKANLTWLNKKLSLVPLSDLGMVIKKIKPKSDDEYIEETIFLKNTSTVSRRAVIEQIISGLSKNKIKELLAKMDDYKNNLKGLKRTEYEVYSEDVYNRIKALLSLSK